LATGPRAIVVPFAAASETEQTLRAEILAARGHLTIVAEAVLSGATLADAIATALAQALPPPLTVMTDGAAETARQLMRRSAP
jgi:predicted glycosyltransferase